MKVLGAIRDILITFGLIVVTGFLVMATAYGISAALNLGWF